MVNKFINNFKSSNPKEIEKNFLFGNCYWFAFILAERFGGEIYYLPIKNHFITKINEIFYDITGKVALEERAYKWTTYKTFDPLEANRIERDCIFQI